MELHVLYNRSGKILAAVPLEEDSSDRTRNGNRRLPALRPEPGPGQYTANVKVPHDCAHLSFFEVCTQLVVEGRGERATLGPRKASQRPAAKSRKARRRS
jgi:hypothetical protein